MASSNPAAVIAPVILEPGMAIGDVLTWLREGRTDLEAVRSWATSTPVAMTKDESFQLASCGLSLVEFIEITDAQKKFATEGGRREGAFRITYSKPGRVVLNGLKLNSNAQGKGGFEFSLFPRDLSKLVDGLPLMLAACVDDCDTIIPKGQTVKVLSEAWEAGKEAGKSDADLRKAGVVKFAEVVHPREGQTAMDWTGADKLATVAKLREVLTALRNIKSIPTVKPAGK